MSPATARRHDPDQVHDVAALLRFELFLFSAVATVLIVRAALAATGYPQVGGGGLHVAHVLYGGLLMGMAIIVVQLGYGSRARRLAALLGGVGFGLFIDEVGKFLTKDVNYFFSPSVAIIYAVFVVAYLVVRETLERRELTDPRKLAIGATAAADLALGQLDSIRRDEMVAMLRQVRDEADVADALVTALQSKPPERHGPEAWIGRTADRALNRVVELASHPFFSRGLVVLFVLQLLGIAFETVIAVVKPAIGQSGGSQVTDVGVYVSAGVAGVLTVVGLSRLGAHRVGALRVLQVAADVNLLFAQIFMFARYQWSGLLGFAGQLVVILAIRLAFRSMRADARAATVDVADSHRAGVTGSRDGT